MIVIDEMKLSERTEWSVLKQLARLEFWKQRLQWDLEDLLEFFFSVGGYASIKILLNNNNNNNNNNNSDF